MRVRRALVFGRGEFALRYALHVLMVKRASGLGQRPSQSVLKPLLLGYILQGRFKSYSLESGHDRCFHIRLFIMATLLRNGISSVQIISEEFSP